MDVAAVREAGLKAAEHARSGKGPFILEMKTYRYRGHSMSDPGKYRTREEVDEVRKTRDPIDHLREKLEADGLADEAALKAIDAEVKAIVADAAEFARTAPEPDPAELYTDVYRGEPPRDRRPDAGPVADHGGGHARQVAREGRRHGQLRRRDRRDRDRQGDHGGRGGRRGRGRGAAGAGRDRGREGQHADRPAERRRARRRRPPADRQRRSRKPRAPRKRLRLRPWGEAATPTPTCEGGRSPRPSTLERDPRRRQADQDHASATPCATPWPRRCAAIRTSS